MPFLQIALSLPKAVVVDQSTALGHVMFFGTHPTTVVAMQCFVIGMTVAIKAGVRLMMILLIQYTINVAITFGIVAIRQ